MNDYFEYRKLKIAEGEEDVCDKQFDEKLLEIPHYRNHEEWLPFIGKDFAEQPTKILFVGESHHISGGTLEDDKERYTAYETTKTFWYKEDFKNQYTKFCKSNPNNIMDEMHGSYYTRGVINRWLKGWKSKSYNIFRFPLKVYIGKYKEDKNVKGKYRAGRLTQEEQERYKEVAFMNYFQFPAFGKGASFKEYAAEEDKECAYKTLKEVIKILKRKKSGEIMVVFLSSYAYDAFKARAGKDFDEEHIHLVMHPCSPAWNKDNGDKGYKALMRILGQKVN